MEKNRLEAFSDGVFAIVITIMVLDLKVPKNPGWKAYLDSYPIFASYVLSFALIGICWVTHHHLLHSAKKVDSKVLITNMLLLFWQSLIPFTTAVMGENSFTNITVAVYAMVLTFGLIAYILFVKSLVKLHGVNSEFAKIYKNDKRGYISIGITAGAAIIAIAGFPKIAFAVIALASMLWLVSFLAFEKEQAT